MYHRTELQPKRIISLRDIAITMNVNNDLDDVVVKLSMNIQLTKINHHTKYLKKKVVYDILQ